MLKKMKIVLAKLELRLIRSRNLEIRRSRILEVLVKTIVIKVRIKNIIKNKKKLVINKKDLIRRKIIKEIFNKLRRIMIMNFINLKNMSVLLIIKNTSCLQKKNKVSKEKVLKRKRTIERQEILGLKEKIFILV